MLDHVSVQCADVAASSAFYDRVLAPLGVTRAMDFGQVIGYGIGGNPKFWVGPLVSGEPNREVHIAFSADDRASVRAFFDQAVSLGATVPDEPGDVARVPRELLRGFRTRSARQQRRGRLPQAE